MRKKRFSFFLLSLLFLFSCATTSKIPKSEQPVSQLIIKEPIYIELNKKELQIYDDVTLFKKAEEALDNGELDKGIYLYYMLLKKFPESSLVPATLFNLGATYEEKKEYEKARKFYQYLVDHYPDNSLVPRALFRIAIILEKEEKFREALRIVRELEKKNLSGEDHLKLTALKGILLTEAGNEKRGVEILEKVDRIYSEKSRKGINVDRYFWGWVRFTLAEVVFKKFQEIHVTATTKEEIRQQLERKASLLLQAMSLYFKTLKTHSTHWATAAVYRMGLLYELFYVEIVSINPPAGLSEEEKEVYYEELTKVLEPVKKKAIETYKKIIWYAKQWGINTPWIEKAKKHIEILREFKIYRPKG